jgi:hypothetical protein
MLFGLRSWLRKRKTRKAINPKSHNSASRRLSLEQLEERCLLSAAMSPGLPVVAPGLAASASSGDVANPPIINYDPQGIPAPPPNAFTPQQIRLAYGFNQIPGLFGSLYNNAGSGQTIAIIDAYGDPNISNDVQQFDEYFNIGGALGDPTNFSFLTVVNQSGGSTLPTPDPTSGGEWAAETSLDVEWAHAIAPGANILLVEADNPSSLPTAIEFAERQPGVSVISMSFGAGEGGNDLLADNIYTTPLGHQGIVFVAASGDIGNGNPPQAAEAQYPAASPNVLGVGGTVLTLMPSSTPGQSPVPTEVAWNGSNGGASQFEAEPSYQVPVVPATMATNPISGPNMRATPDVAYAATSFAIYDSFSTSYSTKQGGPWSDVGGTSAGAPQWAALIAIADQQIATVDQTLGFSGFSTLDGPTQLLPALYQIGNSSAFTDITMGQSTTDGQPLNAAGTNLYQNAVIGYDLATGLGTPNAPALIQYLINMFATAPAVPQTITWTGNAGNQDWDTPGNWSSMTVPGPLDNVVINGNGVLINHSNFVGPIYFGSSYDKISSLTVTGTKVTLNLSGGTLDLSGSGSDGMFQVDQPGDTVNLQGGTLANATVSKSTIITVNGTGIVDGGIFYGTLNVGVGSTLDLAGSWTNMMGGTITASHATVYLGDTWDVGINPVLPLTYDGWGNFGTITLQFDQVFLGGGLSFDPSYNNLATLDLSTDVIVLTGTLYNVDSTLTLVAGATNTSLSGNWSMQGGRIDGGTIGSGGLVVNGSGTLDGVTNAGSIQVNGGGTLNVLQGSVINGQIATFVNTGQITTTGNAALNLYGNWTNSGTIQGGSGGTLSLGAPVNILPTSSSAPNYIWTNTGTISAGQGSTVNLGGVIFTDDIEALLTNFFSLLGSTVNLTGTLDNAPLVNPVTNGVLTLNSTTGPLNLSGGRIYQGTVVTTGSNDLVASNVVNGTLDGVTLDGTLDMTQSQGAYVEVVNSLTLNGTIELGGAQNTTNYGVLVFGDYNEGISEQINGTGTILFGQDSGTGAKVDSLVNVSNKPLIIGPNITVLGGLIGYIYSPFAIVSNNGTIDENTSFGRLVFQNQGNIALNGDTISISGGSGLGLVNSGTVLVDQHGLLQLTGAFAYFQLSGITKVNGVFSAPNIFLNGGLLTGTGTYNGAPLSSSGPTPTVITQSGGTITPGDAPGTLTVQGNYIQESGGALDIEIGGGTEYSQLAVSGSVVLSGTLDMSLFNGFTATEGESFQMVTFGQLYGDFSTLDGVALGNSELLNLSYSSAAVTSLVIPAGPPTLYWTGDAADGNWDDPGNWSDTDPLINNVPESILPVADTNVVIDLPNQTIQQSTGNYDTISSLTVTGQDDTLDLTGGTLDLSGITGEGSFQADQAGDVVNLDGGTLKNADVTFGTTIIAGSSPSVLDDVQLDGILDMTPYYNAKLQILDGLTLNGKIELGGTYTYASLDFGQNDNPLNLSVSGTGIIQFGQSTSGDYFSNYETGTLTFGSNITIEAGLNSAIYSSGSPIDNQGLIEENTASGLLTIDVPAWVNDGSITVSNGATATLEGQGWSNSTSGQITAKGATLNLYGSWLNDGAISADSASTIGLGSPVDIAPNDPNAPNYIWSNQGTLSLAAGSKVNLGGLVTTDQWAALMPQLQADGVSQITFCGTLDNTAADNPVSGGILALDASTGPLYLSGGEIYGGTITTSGDDNLVATTQGGTLNGVTLDGTLDITQSQGATVTVENGLVLNGTIELGGAAGTSDSGVLNFSGSVAQAVGGTGTIQFGQDAAGDSLNNTFTEPLTFGPQITIVGGLSGDLSGAFDNQGLIEQNTAGGQLTINSTVNVDASIENDGSIEVGNGATLTIQDLGWSNSITGQITATAATLNLYGSWINNGAIAADSATVSLGSPINIAANDKSAPSYAWSSPGSISITAGSTLDLGGVFTTDSFEDLVADLAANAQSLAQDILFLTGTLDDSAADNPLSGGVLALDAATGPLYLDGGRIYQGNVSTSGDNELLGTSAGGTLDGVQLNGNLNMAELNSVQGELINVTVIDSLTLNGTVELGGAGQPGETASLAFGSSGQLVAQTIDGTGTIQFGLDSDGDSLGFWGDLTIGAHVTIQGGLLGGIYSESNSTNQPLLDNLGTIVENSSARTASLTSALFEIDDPGFVNNGSITVGNGDAVDVDGLSWSNTGTITATDGTLNLDNHWTNTGGINVDSSSTVGLGSPTPDYIDPTSTGAANYVWTNLGTLAIAPGATVNLGGVFTSDEYAALAATGSMAEDTVNLTGTMNNSPAANPIGGGVLALSATTGPLILADGGIYQGTITTSGSDNLAGGNDLADGGATLDGVELDGTLSSNTTYGSYITIMDGLTLDGTMTLDGHLAFGNGDDNTAQTVDGTGTIVLGGTLYGSSTLANYSNETLTIGPNITIQCDPAAPDGLVTTIIGSSFDFQGNIIEDTSSDQLVIDANFFANDGSIAVSNGATAMLGSMAGGGSTWINSATGQITVTGATLDLYASWTNYGTISVKDSSTVSLGYEIQFSPVASYASAYYWSNRGVISIAAGSTVDLAGAFTTDAFEGLVADLSGQGQSLANDVVNLTGALDNSVADNPVSGGILALDAATGPLNLAGGYIYQGSISTVGADDLVGTAANGSGNWLDGVTLEGTLDMTQSNNAVATIINGLTLNGTILLGGGSGAGNFATLFFDDDGAPQTVAGTGTIEFGQNSSGALIQDFSNETITFGPGITIQGGLFSQIYTYRAAGAIDIEGAIRDDTSGGVLYVLGVFSNNSGGTLTGGTWEVSNGGAMWINGFTGTTSVPFNITTNAATIAVSGADSGIYLDDTGTTSALANFTTNTAAGSFTVADGYTFTAPSDFSNAGALTVGSGGTFTTGTADYNQSAGTTTIDGILSAADVNLDGGTLNGTGSIQANVTNAATIQAGDQAPGTLSVQGNYTQTSTGTLNIGLGSLSQFGQLASTGSVNLDGTLNVTLVNGFTPSPGDSFQIIPYVAHSGDFVTENGLNLGNGNTLVPAYNTEALTLVTSGGTQSLTTVTVNTTGGPSTVYGQSVTFIATVSAINPGAGTPTGSVQFLIGGQDAGSPVSLSGGTATLVVSSLSAGSPAVTALYTSDSSFFANSQTSGPFTELVSPAPLTVSANNESRAYGSANPTLSYTYSGLVNGDNASVFTGSLATVATANSPAGSYSITQGTLSAGTNYTINFTAGTLTVTGANSAAGQIIGTAAPPITGYEYSALTQVPLATFTQGNGSQAPGNFQVTINWDDGTALDTTSSQVTESGGVYTITGSHTYNEESETLPTGNYAVSVDVTDGTNSATVNSTVTILEPLLANGTVGTPNNRFINLCYIDLLGREADMPSLLAWSSLLDAGVSRLVVVQMIENAPQNEYRFHLVDQLYEQFLHRSGVGDPGVAGWVAMLQAGDTVEQVEAGIVNSPEYIQDRTNGTFDSWLTAFYGDVLGRAPDADGRAGWDAYSVGKTDAEVALAIMTSAALPGASANEYRLDLVNSFYELLLTRTAVGDPAQATWASQLQAGVRYEEVVALIVADPNYNEFYDIAVA